MRKLATAAAVSLALAGSGGAFALGLGDIEMRSALNQPMNAEIPLTSVKRGELEGMIVQLADEDAFARAGIERAGALGDLLFSVDSSAGRPVIRVTSDRPVVEPFLNFLLEVDWPQGRMVREYTVLLDPPVFMTQGPSARDVGAEQRAVAATDAALVAPAPIDRAGGDEGFEVELVDAAGEIGDESLLGADAAGEVVSLDELDAAPADAGTSAAGEVVPLTDLEAPNTDAASERAATLPDDFEVELVGEGVEVGDDVGGSDDLAPADAGGEIVSLEEIEAPATDVPETDAGSASEEIRVARGDTLYRIAEANVLEGVSVQQMMLALLEANRSAFINDNINLVKAGAILRVPAPAEARALSQAQALAEIGRQNELWREYRDNLRGTIGGTRLASGDADEGTASDSGAAGTAAEEADAGGLSAEARDILESAREEVRRREELRIVAADTSASGAASATADESEGGDAARLGQINRQLQLAREELSATRLESGDLGEQADELQSTRENLDALVALRQNEIARLEAQLAEARSAASESAASAVDVSEASTESAAAENDEEPASGTDVAAVAAEGAEAAEVAVTEAGEALEEKVADAAAAISGGASEVGAEAENALGAAGETLESVELVGDEEAAGEATETVAATADAEIADGSAAVGATGEPWYRALLGDPTRLGILGAGALGLGLLATLLLWRRRGGDAEAEAESGVLAGFDESDVEFIDDGERAAPPTEFDGHAEPSEGRSDTVGIAAGAAAVAGGAAFAADERGGSESELSDAEPDKDDTISEVDVYLAYGLHGQAEELLLKARERHPESPVYAEKLLETYRAQGNADAYGELAAEYHARFGGEANPAWAGIAEGGRELSPGEALFAAGAGGVAAIGTGTLDGPQLGDDDFAASVGDGEIASSVSRDFGAAEESLDFDAAALGDGLIDEGDLGDVDESALEGLSAFDENELDRTVASEAESVAPFVDGEIEPAADAALDDETMLMDQSLDPAFAFDEGDLEATGDFSQIASELAAEEDGIIDFPGFEADGPLVGEAEVDDAKPADQGQPTELPGEGALEDALTLDELDVGAGANAANDAAGDDALGLGAVSDELTLDLDELSDGLDLEEGALDASAEPLGDERAVAGTVEGGVALDDGADEMDTMMDLAKAYIDMGDKDSASNALDEIVKSGSPEQVSEAETLLRKIS